jgi:hypothetical protein
MTTAAPPRKRAIAVCYTELNSDHFKEFWDDEPVRGRLMTTSLL